MTSSKRRKLAVLAFLAAAALALSGCWENIYKFSNGDRDITLTQDFSHRLIYNNCTPRFGHGSARDFCALDVINAVCRAVPEKGISQDDCLALSNPSDWEHMDSAIHQVIATGGCLVFYEAKVPTASDDYWGSVGAGALACK